MKPFIEHLRQHPNNLFKASEAYCYERGWKREQWYEAWQTTELPKEVEVACYENLLETYPWMMWCSMWRSIGTAVTAVTATR